MSKTIEEVLLEKYAEFRNDAIKVVPEYDRAFKEVDTSDLIDMLELLLFLFPDDKTEFNLNQLLELESIELTASQTKSLIPLIDKYVEFLNKIKKLL